MLRPSLRPLVLLMGVVLALGLAACGSSSDDEKKIKDRVNGMYDALAAKDAGKVCDSLTEDQQKAVTRGTAGSGKKKQSCEDVLGLGLSFLGKQVEQVKDVKVTKVKVDGDKGTATVDFKGKKQDVSVAKEGGDWKVADLRIQNR